MGLSLQYTYFYRGKPRGKPFNFFLSIKSKGVIYDRSSLRTTKKY